MVIKRKNVIWSIVAFVLVLATLFASGCQPEAPEIREDEAAEAQQTLSAVIEFTALGESKAKNVILLIGDGMGFEQLALGRMLGAPLAMDAFTYTGYVSTHHDNSNRLSVTDSAASGTAIACGIKTKKYSVGVDKDGIPAKSIMWYAKEAGKATGLVTTTRVTDATVAAFVANNPIRGNEEAIAEDMLAMAPDVLLGGGKKRFTADTRGDGKDLLSEAQTRGYTLVSDALELSEANTSMLLGLFAQDKMPYTIDKDKNAPTLKEMTLKTLEILSSDPDGFFVMIEGGRIDHACHANDGVTAAYEVRAFDEAVAAALEFARQNEETLVIVTADHETGGLTLSTEDQAAVAFEGVLASQSGSIFESIVPDVNWETDALDCAAFAEKHFGISGLDKKTTDALSKAFLKEKEERLKNASVFGRALADLVSSQSNPKWATRSHSGKNVPIMAYGPYANRCTGFMDNTDIFKVMVEAMGFATIEEIPQ